MVNKVMEYLIVNLVSCLTLPVCCNFLADLVAEISLGLYFLAGIELFEEFFVEFFLLQQADLGNGNLEMLCGIFGVILIQSEIAHDELQFLRIEGFVELKDHEIVYMLTHEAVAEAFLEIFY